MKEKVRSSSSDRVDGRVEDQALRGGLLAPKRALERARGFA